MLGAKESSWTLENKFQTETVPKDDGAFSGAGAAASLGLRAPSAPFRLRRRRIAILIYVAKKHLTFCEQYDTRILAIYGIDDISLLKKMIRLSDMTLLDVIELKAEEMK